MGHEHFQDTGSLSTSPGIQGLPRGGLASLALMVTSFARLGATCQAEVACFLSSDSRGSELLRTSQDVRVPPARPPWSPE